MNTFAWNITLRWNNTIGEFDFDYVENLSKDWNKVLYVFWDTELENSEDLVDFLGDKLWAFINHDLSISTENKISIVWDSFEEGVYELATFEWEQVDFDDLLDRFIDFDWVISVREAEISTRFWNKVVKVDFVY
jgi:hypothetical protein